MFTYLDFILFFDEGRDRSADFLRFLPDFLGDKIRIGEVSGSSADFSLLNLESLRNYSSVSYRDGVISWGVSKGSGLSFVSFKPDLASFEADLNYMLFIRLFFASCKRLGACYGFADQAEKDRRPLTDRGEFCSDPFLFCLEPPFLENMDGLPALKGFLNSDDTKSRLSEIRKVMGVEELLKLMRKYSFSVVVGEAGVGVHKIDPHASLPKKGPPAVFPRFFVRRELRRRGVDLGRGWAEKYAEYYQIGGKI